MPTPLAADQLRQATAKLPRVPLAHLPTPLEEVPRFAARLNGPRVYVKRDDCTGMVMGGNKTRHNEFLLGAALRPDADCLVWGAGVQSNNCRQTAAACNKLGLECYLYLSRAAHNDDVQGNLLLDHLLGAHITVIDTPLGPALDELLLAKAEELRAAGRRPFVWDRTSGRPIAAVSYALALAELLEQALDLAPSSAEAHTLMGILRESWGQDHAAYRSYRTALEADPHFGPARDNLRRYCERFGLDYHSKAINPGAE